MIYMGLALVLVTVLGCSGSHPNRERVSRARNLAYASQGMVHGASLGSMCMMETSLSERPAHPNPYVGELLFKRYCDSCHGKGSRGPAILKNRVHASDEESDYYIIQYGYADMPGFRTRLTQFQIYDVLSYIWDGKSVESGG